jgi:hypothetical protein
MNGPDTPQDRDTIQAAIAATRELDPAKRHDAAFHLKKIGPEVKDAGLRAQIVDAFMEILSLPPSNEYGPCRYNAATALGLMGDGRAVDLLIRSLNDPGWMIRTEAAYSLGKLKDPRALPHLRNALVHPDDATRMAAAKALQDF